MTESSSKVIINSTISFIYSLVRVIKSLEAIDINTSEIEKLIELCFWARLADFFGLCNEWTA